MLHGSYRLAAGVSFSVLAALSASTASAQDQVQAAALVSPEVGPAADIPGEIIVTAQRRPESAQDVPIAVSAISAAQVEQLGIHSLTDIQILTPGASFGDGYTFAQLYIRGVGAQVVTPGLESPVAVYSEGVYLQRSLGVADLLDQYDPGSIQVLRGPQGTLYGRNATGGAVLIASADPTDRLEGAASAEYGRFDHVQLDAMLNLPITPTLRLRLAGRYRDEDGYVRNRADGDRQGGRRVKAVRAKLAWEPTDTAEFLLTAEYQRNRRGADLEQLGDVGPSCLLCASAGITTTPGFYEQDVNGGNRHRGELFSTSLRARVDVGALTVTSLTGYRYDKDVEATDQDFTPIDAFTFRTPNTGGKTFTQDLQVASQLDGPLDFLAGASYLHDKGIYAVQFSGALFPPVGGELPTSTSRTTTESISVFGEAYYALTDQLKLTAGGRYTFDDRRLDGDLNAGFGGPLVFSQKFDYKAFTPRFVLAWDNGPTNIYYSYSRGFKSGGFFTPALGPVVDVTPEKTYSHELGVKSRALDNRLRMSLALFYYKNKNLQTTVIDTLGGGSRAINAGAVRGYGAEFDAQFTAAQGLVIGGSVSYLDAEYTSFPNALVKCLDTGPLASPALSPLFECTQDLGGVRPPHAPRFTLGGYANYDVELGEWTANFAVVGRYQSAISFYPGAGGVPGRAVDLTGTGHLAGSPIGYDRQSGYTIVNLSAYVSPPGARTRVGFYVDNALNTKYTNFKVTSAPFGMIYAAAKPITYGARVSYRF